MNVTLTWPVWNVSWGLLISMMLDSRCQLMFAGCSGSKAGEMLVDGI